MTILNQDPALLAEPANRIIRVENCQISYPHLWQPFGQGENRKKYGVECILDPNVPAHAQVMQEIDYLTGMFLQEHSIDPQFARKMSPLRDGNERNQAAAAQGRKQREEIANKWTVNASDDQFAPQVYDQQRQLIPEAQSANVFGGCICNVVFNLYWYNAPQNRGVAAGLKMVQLVNNVGVDRFGGDHAWSETQAQQYLMDVPGSEMARPAPLAGTPGNVGPAPTLPGSKPDWA